MTKTLLVAEKPKVAKRIADALGDYTVEKNHQVKNYHIETDRGKLVIAPAVGHLFSLEQKSDEWDYPKFDVEWVPTPQKNDSADYMKKYLKNLREQGKDAELFINGCDFDIEGSTIGFNAIKLACNGEKDRIKRMKFSTLTSSDLKKAFDNLNEFDRGQTEAGLTRHVLDWYYGINLSRALMKAVKKNNRYKSLSTGRVQGPALKILTEKERKIQEFEPEDYWEVYLHSKDLEAKHEADKIWKEAKADAILKKCKDSQAKVANIKRNRYKHNPPSPFNLTGLQKEASSQFNIKPKKTQQLAQNLYESSLISYPRTESQKLSKKIGYKNILNKLKKQDKYEDKAEKVLKKKKLKPNQGKKKDKAHPAIHPTGLKPKKLGKKEKRIYDLIVKRFFAVFGKPAKRESVKTTLDIQGEKFNAKAKRTLERNWFNLYDPYVKVKEQEVPELKERETVQVEKLEKEEKQTKPPKRYKQSSLVSELEKKDLGTKSTRAQIVESLYDRKYIKNSSIEVTDLGMAVVEALEKHAPEILSEKLTRQFEEDMEKIKEEEKDRKDVIEEAEQTLEEILQKFKQEEKEVGKGLIDAIDKTKKKKRQLGPCDKCENGTLRIVKTKGSRFVGCSNYPDCENTYPLPKNGKIESMDKKCEECGKPMIKVIRKGKKPYKMCIDPDCPSKDDW